MTKSGFKLEAMNSGKCSQLRLWNEVSVRSGSKQWIQESVVNFVCETKSVSKQDDLIPITHSNKIVQWTETIRFPSYFSFHHSYEWDLLFFRFIIFQ